MLSVYTLFYASARFRKKSLNFFIETKNLKIVEFGYMWVYVYAGEMFLNSFVNILVSSQSLHRTNNFIIEFFRYTIIKFAKFEYADEYLI